MYCQGSSDQLTNKVQFWGFLILTQHELTSLECDYLGQPFLASLIVGELYAFHYILVIQLLSDPKCYCLIWT